MKLVAGLGLLAVLIGAGAAGGAGSASRIVDVTMLCRPFGEGHPDPVRVIGATASPRFGRDAAAARVDNGYRAEGVSAGFATGPSHGQPAGVWLSRSTCSATRVAVPLSTKGLRGGRVDSNTPYKCDVPDRVLLRLRAVFTRPVTLVRDPRATYQSIARGNIRAAWLVVTTSQAKAILFASADARTGRARIFRSSSRCRPH